LQLPRRFLDEMVQQARAELPNECVGLLAGRFEETPGGRVGRVERRYSLVNAAASPKEYLSDGDSMFAAWKDWRVHDLEVLAIYHSHPTSAPIPSRTDLERNYSPEVVNFIISLTGSEPEVRGWWLTDRDYREAEWDCTE
jgi:proteasome lid subunit RPN8/RPN11